MKEIWPLGKLTIPRLVANDPNRALKRVRQLLFPTTTSDVLTVSAIRLVLEEEGYGEKPGILARAPKTDSAGAEFVDANTCEEVFKAEADAEGVAAFLRENEALDLESVTVEKDDEGIRWLVRVAILVGRENAQAFDRGYVLAALSAWQLAAEGG
jgi:hypothetical protein